MATIMSFDAMLSADEGDEVQVGVEINADSVFIDFTVGEDEDEITFAFDLSDARKWKLAFIQAARVASLAERLHAADEQPCRESPCDDDDDGDYNWDEMGP